VSDPVNETRQIDTRDETELPAENTVEESTVEGAEPSILQGAGDQTASDVGPADGADDSGDEDADGGTDGDEAVRPGRRERLEQEGDIAADYLEELLEISDLDGDLDMDVEGDRATVSIVGADLPQLVGDQGEVLEALQELTRLAVYRETGERSRLMLDVSGHRAQRRTALEEQATRVVAEVRESGERATLEPMSPFERKVVHDVVAAAGLTSESEGTEPRRFVVVLPE
jgi:spoIIIJ-associated protein